MSYKSVKWLATIKQVEEVQIDRGASNLTDAASTTNLLSQVPTQLSLISLFLNCPGKLVGTRG
jgi:hypothetical protein